MQKNLLNLQNPRDNIKSFLLLENAKGTKVLNYYATFKTQENQRFSANDTVLNFIVDKIIAPYKT